MFNLIITVLSIVLVAVLSVASVYFGGDIFGKQSAEAEVNRYVNEAKQIRQAIDVYRITENSGYPSSINELVSKNYLSSEPSANWSVSEGALQTDFSDSQVPPERICRNVNEAIGAGDTIPECSAMTSSSAYFCCNKTTP